MQIIKLRLNFKTNKIETLHCNFSKNNINRDVALQLLKKQYK
jgi:hypothetical protein